MKATKFKGLSATKPALASAPLMSAIAVESNPPTLDYRIAFDLAPVGMVLSRHRLIQDCNQQLLEMFGAKRDELVGQSLQVLYPTHEEFERTGQRIAASLNASGWYADDRVMKRMSGSGKSRHESSAAALKAGELFWCHVSGRALDPTQPHAAGIWTFEDLSLKRRLGADLTPREREIAALLIDGLTSKLIGKQLGISPRTVDVYRARLTRKFGASTTADLVQKLLLS